MPSNKKIIIGHQSPTFGTNPLMIFLNKIGTTFRVATTWQLHHLSPLVQTAKFVTISRIVVIAVTFNLVVIVLIFFATHHFADVQVFSHNSHRSQISRCIFTFYSDIIVATAIARISKLLVGILTNTPISTQRLGMVKRHVLAAGGFTDTTARCNTR